MTDWSALSGNPVPGDPAGVRAMATAFDDQGTRVRQQIRLVQATAATGTLAWQGPAANAFRGSVGQLVPALQTMADNHANAASALNTYAGQLEGFQHTAQQYAAQATGYQQAATKAQQDVVTCQGQVSQAQSAYNSATLAQFLNPMSPVTTGAPSPFSPVVSPPSPLVPSPSQQAVNTAYANLQTAQGNLSSATGAWKSAETSLGHVQSLANTLNGQASAAAQVCADKVNAAAKPASAPGKLNPVAAFLQSDTFTALCGYIDIPKKFLDPLEEKLKDAGKDLAAAEDAEDAFLAQLKRARWQVRNGATRGLRSSAKQLLKDQNKIKAELQDAADAAEGTKTDAENAVNAFTDGLDSTLPTKAWLTASKVFAYSWTDAAGAASKLVTGGGATAAEEDAAESLLAQTGDKIPVVGTVITAGVTGYDISQGHYTDAAGDTGGFVASVAVGGGLVLMTATPAGWVVVASIGAGIVVSEGIDHWRSIVHAGQSIIDLPGDFVNSFAHSLEELP